MTLEQFRDYCLALGDVTEKMPFGKFASRFDSVLVFYVKNHMFCLCDIDNFTFVELPTTPDKAITLEESHEAVSKTINRALKTWIHIDFSSSMSESEIFSLIKEAYNLINAKYR